MGYSRMMLKEQAMIGAMTIVWSLSLLLKGICDLYMENHTNGFKRGYFQNELSPLIFAFPPVTVVVVTHFQVQRARRLRE